MKTPYPPVVEKFNKNKHPKRFNIIEENIPNNLKKINQWVCWKWFWDGKKWTKPPVDDKFISINHLLSELSYKEVIEAFKNNDKIAGIGFSIRKNDNFCGIDFDDVINKNRKINKRVKKSLKILKGTYCEFSPGGGGIRVFGIGKPKTRGSKGAREIEIYNSGRYLTITGHKISDSRRLIEITKQCNRINKKIYGEDKSKRKNNNKSLKDHENENPQLQKIKKFIFQYYPETRKIWIKVGMVVHYETNGSEAGFDMWAGWSRMTTADNFSEEACFSVWKSFKKKTKGSNPLTMATFYYDKKLKELEDSTLTIISHKTLEKEDIPDVENILDPWFMKNSINMVHAKRGLGKTHFCIGLGLTLASGGEFLKWKAKGKSRVLYVDGEMPIALFKQFINVQKKATGLNPKAKDFQIITIDKQKDGLFPSLSEEKGRDLIELAINKIEPDVIIFDSLSTCFKIDEGGHGYWHEIQDWLIKLRSFGINVLLVHHDNKTGKAQSGRVNKEAVLNSVIHLLEPKGLEGNKSARFQVVFTKKRHFYEDSDPFEARLKRLNENHSEWEVLESEKTTQERVISLIKDGNNPIDIANELECSVTNVRRHIKKCMQEGSISETDCQWSARRKQNKNWGKKIHGNKKDGQ